ncbi:MAG: N-formylglutamate amidohydrolase [Kiloniellales bacterium]
MHQPLAKAELAPALLAADEPAPFRVFNDGGKAPLVLVCDHASAFMPRSLADLGLDAAALARHIAWDIGIAEVAERLATALDAPAVLSHFSRLIVDPNRPPDDPTRVPELSDGAIVPGNRGLGESQIEARVATFFEPYHVAIERQIDRKLTSGKAPAILSLHSFTPVMKGETRPWEIGILWNRDPRLPVPLMAALADQGIAVGDNHPYSGRDGHGYTLHRHAEPRGFAHALIEVRQDLIDTHEGAERWSARLAGVLGGILADPGLYRVERY